MYYTINKYTISKSGLRRGKVTSYCSSSQDESSGVRDGKDETQRHGSQGPEADECLRRGWNLLAKRALMVIPEKFRGCLCSGLASKHEGGLPGHSARAGC